MNYNFNSEEHIHELDGKPLMGTSTVTGVIAKPLTWWASGLAVAKLGWINSKLVKKEARVEAVVPYLENIKQMQPDAFLALLDEAYKAHATKLKDSASSGTDLHAELERFVKNTMENRMATYDEKIMPFIVWTEQNVDKFIYSEMNCFSERLWLGGISDCGVKLKDGRTGIIDFKSSKESYDSQFIQIALYDIQISENGGYLEDGTKVFTVEKPFEFYAVVPFGAEKFTVDFRYNVEELKTAGEACVTLYKTLNK